MGCEEIHEQDLTISIPSSSEIPTTKVSAVGAGIQRTPLLTSLALLVVVLASGFLPNNPISREVSCLRLSIESAVERDEHWPSLPLWARYDSFANFARTNEDGHFFLEKAIEEVRKYEGSDYWVARLLQKSARIENAMGYDPQRWEAHLRESLVKFLATRGPRDPNASRYWWSLGAFYEDVPQDYRRAKQCYERSLVSTFVSQGHSSAQHYNIQMIETMISRMHELAGNKSASHLIDYERDFCYEDVDLVEGDLCNLIVAEQNEDFLQMPGWPLPHRLYSDTIKCWTILHDSPKEIDALYQLVLRKRAEQIRIESSEGATILNRYAGFLRRQGRIDEAAKLEKKVIEIRDKQPKPVYLPPNWKQLADDTSLP